MTIDDFAAMAGLVFVLVVGFVVIPIIGLALLKQAGRDHD